MQGAFDSTVWYNRSEIYQLDTTRQTIQGATVFAKKHPGVTKHAHLLNCNHFVKRRCGAVGELKHRFEQALSQSKTCGEHGELSCHPNGGEVSLPNGPFAGQTLRHLLMQSDKNLLGENCRDNT